MFVPGYQQGARDVNGDRGRSSAGESCERIPSSLHVVQPQRVDTNRLLWGYAPAPFEEETEGRGFPLELPFRARCALLWAAFF